MMCLLYSYKKISVLRDQFEFQSSGDFFVPTRHNGRQIQQTTKEHFLIHFPVNCIMNDKCFLSKHTGTWTSHLAFFFFNIYSVFVRNLMQKQLAGSLKLDLTRSACGFTTSTLQHQNVSLSWTEICS